METVPLLLLTLLGFHAVVQVDGNDPARQLIEKLRSDDAKTREEATRKLAELGDAAKAVLERTARGDDLEVASRAKLLLRVIEVRARLSRTLLETFPGIEFRLGSDDPHEWTTAFLNAVQREDGGRRKYPGLRRSDLAPLAAPALRGAKTAGERCAACTAIGEQGQQSARPELRPLLQDDDEGVRSRALTALAQIGARDAIPDMLPLLRDPKTGLRGHAAGILGEWRVKEAIPDLVRMLGDFDSGNRQSAARALLGLRAKSVVPELLDLLGGKDLDARLGALSLLGELGAKEAFPKIVPLLKVSDQELQTTALEALGSLGVPEAVDAILPLLEDKDPMIRTEAASALGKLGARAHAPKLIALLRDKEIQRKGWIVLALNAMGDTSVIPDLVKLLRDEDSDVRWAAASALGYLKGEHGVQDLLAALEKETELEVRKVLVASLAENGKPEAIRPLIRLLEVPELRTEVIDALADLGATEAAPRLLELLRSDDADAHDSAVDALAQLKYKPAITTIAAFLENEDATLRDKAATALGRLGAIQYAPALESRVDDLERRVRVAAAAALCLLGSRKGVSVLIEEGELRTLNALRRPEQWRALAAKAVEDGARSRQITSAALAKAVGMPLDYSGAPEAAADPWDLMPWKASVPSSALGLLESAGSDDAEMILETDRIRVLPVAEARAWWKKWWDDENKSK